MKIGQRCALLLAAVIFSGACSEADSEGANTTGPKGASNQQIQEGNSKAKWFDDVASKLGEIAKHYNGFSPKRFLPETMGAGGALADFDGDGRLDVYLVNHSNLANSDEASGVTNRLFLQTAPGRFEDKTTDSGAAADSSFGQGCAVADVDGDGDQDIYLLNVGSNRLLLNDGKGVFRDVTAQAGVGDDRWGMSGAFFDYDRDGDLDLFCVNYVDFTVAKHVDCYLGGLLAYCSPHAYDPVANVLYRNNGDGTFTDVSKVAGIASSLGKGLGIAVGDCDADGFPDVYVANDGTANFLFRNLGDGRFEEIGVESGTAYNESGVAEAGMGTDMADLNGDGRLDIVVTNLDNELNNVFINIGDGFFDEEARGSGMGSISNPYVGFGIRAFDYDNDGSLDVYVANGHFADNIAEVNASSQYAQSDFLFLGDGRGKFREVLLESGDLGRRVGRGVSTGDIDNDGDIDLLITNNGEMPMLLKNVQETGHHWIGLKLRGKGPARDAYGTIIEIRTKTSTRSYRHEQRGSYVSSHDSRVLFGLGRDLRAESMKILWPNGEEQVVERLKSDHYYEITQGQAPRVLE